jgi:small GTP-binding protein
MRGLEVENFQFQFMENESAQIPHYKVVVLGNSGAGKTSIILRWISDQFSKSSKPTIGSNHQRKRVELSDGPADLFIWDTAGQEQFQALMPLYTRSSSLAIITASIVDEESFQAIPRWIETVISACDPCPPLLLAVNKIDLTENALYSHEEIIDKYGSQFAGVFFISALSGENIENLFSAAANEAARYGKRNQEAPLPPVSKNKSSCC